MNESSNNPSGERTSIGEAVTTALRQPSFLRVMLVLAARVVVLVGIRLGAPILNPIFFLEKKGRGRDTAVGPDNREVGHDEGKAYCAGGPRRAGGGDGGPGGRRQGREGHPERGGP